MCIRMDAADNVATVLEKVSAGEVVDIVDTEKKLIRRVTAQEEIPFAHKISIAPLDKGTLVYKFGVVIGRCMEELPIGRLVHVHNVISIKGAEQVREANR